MNGPNIAIRRSVGGAMSAANMSIDLWISSGNLAESGDREKAALELERAISKARHAKELMLAALGEMSPSQRMASETWIQSINEMIDAMSEHES